MERREGDDDGEWREINKGEKVSPPLRAHMHACAEEGGEEIVEERARTMEWVSVVHAHARKGDEEEREKFGGRDH